MFCASCGKELDETDAFCRSCGRSLSTDKAAVAQSLEEPVGTIPAGAPEPPPRRSGGATASLILGLFSFIPVVCLLVLWVWSLVDASGWLPLGVVILFPRLEHLVFAPLAYLGPFLTRGLFFLFGAAGLLGAIFGHRVRASIRRNGPASLGKGSAFASVSLGYLGVAGWIAYGLVIPFVIAPFFVKPWLTREQIRSNEESAIEDLRAINTAEITYSSLYPAGYSPSLAALGTPKGIDPNLPWDEREKLTTEKASRNAAGLIDEELASSGVEGGYRFTYTAGPNEKAWKVLGLKPKDVIDPKKLSIYTYTIHADPVKPKVTGERHYFTDQSGVIRFEMNKAADADSLPVGE